MKMPKLKIKIVKQKSEYATLPSKPTTEGKVSKVTDSLYLSCFRPANDREFLIKNNFTHVVNCAASSSSFQAKEFPEVKYLRLDIDDNSEQNIVFSMYKAIEFLLEVESQKGKVLLHCKEGKSRSPLIVIAYLMWKERLTRQTALDTVQQARPETDIKLAFLLFLDVWEKMLFRNKGQVVYRYNKGQVEALLNEEAVVYDDSLFLTDQTVVLERESTDECEYFLSLLKKYGPLSQIAC